MTRPYAAVGSAALGGPAMTRDSIFRLASITKPVTAAAVMMLIEDGLIALEDPIGRSLPDFLAERLFEPLGMTDTAFHVPARWASLASTRGTSPAATAGWAAPAPRPTPSPPPAP
ncbi:serine hydrolase [Nonomuraea sp. NPDC050451]|uniref:serine hydrolase n=1 Tax=Nonomuraea sp. NPDC050451 TaxID=3364364 RepID=UPI00379840A4